jgi:transposase-like protein
MEVVKMGHYFTKSGEKRQRYKCKGCGRTFVLNPIKPRNYSEEFKEMVVRAIVKEGVGDRASQ